MWVAVCYQPAVSVPVTVSVQDVDIHPMLFISLLTTQIKVLFQERV